MQTSHVVSKIIKKEFSKMKRLALVIVALIFAIIAITAVSANEISVTVNGERVNFASQQPVIVDGRTLVPVRGVFEMMGFDVDWNQEASQATLTKADDVIIDHNRQCYIYRQWCKPHT